MIRVAVLIGGLLISPTVFPKQEPCESASQGLPAFLPTGFQHEILLHTQLEGNEDEILVFQAKGREMSPALRESLIRLRKRAFDSAAQGGESEHWDQYDPNYDHALLWSREHGLAGAYRMTRVEDAIRTPEGFYLNEEFFLDDVVKPGGFLAKGVELSRAVVDEDFRRSTKELGLNSLWAGVARYIAKKPEYSMIFGAASASAKMFSEEALQVLQRYLMDHHWSEYAGQVRSRNPFVFRHRIPPLVLRAKVQQLRINLFLAELGKRYGISGEDLPTLFISYVGRMGAKAAGFFHDEPFNTFDALMVSDLGKITDKKMLVKLWALMGPELAPGFFAHHELEVPRRFRPSEK